MRPVHFVCICLTLASIFAPAQTNPGPVNQDRFLRPFSRQNRPSRLQGAEKFGAAPDISFGNVVTYGTGGLDANSVAIADVNGDGNLDLVVANGGSGTIGVLLGNGDGTFQPAVTYSTGAGAGSLVVADVNGDGKPDVVLADNFNSVGVMLNNGNGTFQTAVSYNTGGYDVENGSYDPSAIAVADVNGDGKPDLIVVDTCTAGNTTAGCTNSLGLVAVLLNNGDGTFQTAVTYATGGYLAQAVSVADVNGDGKPDLLVANQSASSNYYLSNGSVGVLFGNGNGTFQTAVTYDSGAQDATSITAADVNGDGILDLLVSNQGSCPNSQACLHGSIGVLLGKGDGTFQPASIFDSGGDFTYSLVADDLYGDGTLDLIVANECPDAFEDGSDCDFGEAAVLLGNGNGTFQPALTFGSGGLHSYQVAVADLNKDAKPDLVLTSECNAEACYDATEGLVGVLLNVTPNQPIVTIYTKALEFAYQTPGVSSAPQTVTVSNSGAAALAISSIAITGEDPGDFAQTNNCGSSLAPNSSCQIKVTFTPTALGSRGAELQITDNAPGSPQTVGLAGTVSDFELSVTSQTSLTVTPGQAANYSLSVVGLQGFSQTVNMSCTGQPPQSTCTAKPSSLALTGNGDVNVAIVTSASTAGFTQPFGGPPDNHWLAWWAAFGWTLGMARLFGMKRFRRAWRPRWLYGMTLLCLPSVVALIPACGGGGSSSSGTPPGTYSPTITATYTSGSIRVSHSVKVTLTVQ